MNQKSIERLLVADAFPHGVTHFELIETHISWVILTGEYAYKFKKPLDLGFLDFSELEQRQHYCHEELRLNRRYTPEIYLDVVPVTGTEDTPAIDGAGAILDYAVKMQQFDTSRLLAEISRRDGLEPQLVRAIALELARSHREFPAVLNAQDNPAAMQAAMFQNFDQVREYALDPSVTAQLDTLADWTRAQLCALMPLMRIRVEEGHIKDLHGDLHLNNMVLLDSRVRFFDCIEFNEAFRVMDTIAEIAFLAMDMADRGEPAQQVLNDYLEYSGDYAGLALLDFYRVYFALVRAKVSLMQEPSNNREVGQTAAYQSFARLVALALGYTQERPRFLALMHGVAGSGKSTVAAGVAQQFSAIRLRSDVERKRLFGLLPDDSSEAIEENIYSSAASRQTFEQLGSLCRIVIDSGLPCIVDATFLGQALRSTFLKLAQELKVPVMILECRASQECLAMRLGHRQQHKNDASEAGIEVMQKQRHNSEPFTAQERQYVVAIDSELPFDGELIQQYLQGQ